MIVYHFYYQLTSVLTLNAMCMKEQAGLCPWRNHDEKIISFHSEGQESPFQLYPCKPGPSGAEGLDLSCDEGQVSIRHG